MARSGSAFVKARIAPRKNTSHAALLRRIDARNDAVIGGLGNLSAQDRAEIVEGFRVPHCETCTASCPACVRNRSATIGACPAPHTCGEASEEQLENEKCCLLAHARRPCAKSAI